MNKYVRKLLGVMFQSQQTQQIVRIQPQHLPSSSEEWCQHWQSQGQHWRTEPEISVTRQEELSKCRAIIPDIEKGIYPFKGMTLSRADVEWLLATHENGRGPVDWSDEKSLYERKGLDLRGADLRGVNLDGLLLARMYGGLTQDEFLKATEEQCEMAAVQLQSARLRRAHLEGAVLCKAHLEDVNLYASHLKKAYLRGAHLERTDLFRADLERANLREAHVEGASVNRTRLEGADLADIILSSEKHVSVRLVDINWNDVNLAAVNWTQIQMLGHEYDARQTTVNGQVKSKTRRISEYEKAVRANRQLAVALQGQGLNEEAAHFAYRAQILQRKRFWMQREIGRWFFSLLLALLAGYGYRMWRILAAYVIIVSFCAVAYFVIGIYHPPHLTLLQAFLESITAFHGRVFYELFTPDTPQIWVTAFEAIAGLIIESVFIAMLTQRFFGK
jgi:uncharacterized protein YjbI with pentapeptide repeats